MKIFPRKLLAVAIFVLGLAVYFADRSALSEPGQVVAIKAKKLSLHATADGQRIETLEPEAVKVPLPILEIAPNNRLKVEIGGTHYWLAPHQVETDKKITVESRCRTQQEIYASTRGNLGKCRP